MFFGVSSRRSGRWFIEPFNLIFFGITGWGIDFSYCDVEFFALEINWDHSVIFVTAPKYCILDSLIDYEGYSISSKRFLPGGIGLVAKSCQIRGTPWTINCQAPPSMGFSRQEYWSGLLFPFPEG